MLVSQNILFMFGNRAIPWSIGKLVKALSLFLLSSFLPNFIRHWNPNQVFAIFAFPAFGIIAGRPVNT